MVLKILIAFIAVVYLVTLPIRMIRSGIEAHHAVVVTCVLAIIVIAAAFIAAGGAQ